MDILRTVDDTLSIRGRGTVIVVEGLPANINADNTQVLIQGRLLKIFRIEHSPFCNEVGIVLGDQIQEKKVQIGSFIMFVQKNQENNP